jgi:phage major head subunit gpT-like protein
MSLERLNNRAVLGMIIERLMSSTGVPWVGELSTHVSSDQASEEYAWLGMAPMLREMIGGRLAKTLRDFGFVIENLDFEATLRVLDKDMRRDKTGQLQIRIDEFSQQPDRHWATLLSALIATGHQNICYDGQFFFDTDHGEGDSGVQSNDLTFDVTTPASPTTQEMQDAVLFAVETMFGFKDDNGEPLNEGDSDFIVMTPTRYFSIAAKAMVNPVTGGGDTNPLQNLPGVSLRPTTNARFDPTPNVFYIFSTSGSVGGLIRQEEVTPEISSLDENSDHFFETREHQFGIYTSRNAGYGRWQRAVRMELI